MLTERSSALQFFPLCFCSPARHASQAQTYTINTFCGQWYGGFQREDGGPAANAELSSAPYAVAVDSAGNIFIADLG